MSKHNVHIGTGTPEQFGQDSIKAWKAGEQGTATEIPEERVCFMDLITMLSTLSEKRLQILRELQRQLGVDTYKLAQQLNRDYQNVHTDVSLLKEIGLILANEDGTLQVPFTKVHVEINLAV